MPFSDRAVDIALTITVLQHNTDDEMFDKLVGEICRVTLKLVVLSEAVGVGIVSKDGSWIGRPMQDYQLAMAKGGFQLKGCLYLQTAFGHRVHGRIARKLAPHHKEGDPFPLAARLAFNAALPVTSVLDPLLSPFFSIPLTRMEFIRA